MGFVKKTLLRFTDFWNLNYRFLFFQYVLCRKGKQPIVAFHLKRFPGVLWTLYYRVLSLATGSRAVFLFIFLASHCLFPFVQDSTRCARKTCATTTGRAWNNGIRTRVTATWPRTSDPRALNVSRTFRRIQSRRRNSFTVVKTFLHNVRRTAV